MLKHLKKLNENLEKNWTFVLKLIFTLSVFFLYRVFIKSFDFESLQLFNLIFVMIGFLVYTLDKLLPSVIIFLEILGKTNEKLSEKIRIKSFLSSAFIILSIFSVIMFYITKAYPWASLSILFWCMAVFTTDYFGDYKTKYTSGIVKVLVLTLTILGIISVAHCFVYNVLLNIYLFIFIIVFFIYDFILDYWKLNKRIS